LIQGLFVRSFEKKLCRWLKLAGAKAGLEFLDAAQPLFKNFGSEGVTGQGSGCSFRVRTFYFCRYPLSFAHFFEQLAKFDNARNEVKAFGGFNDILRAY